VSRTRHSVPSAVHGRAWTKNRENNPMQSKVDPGSQTRAALHRTEEKCSVVTAQLDLIPLAIALYCSTNEISPTTGFASAAGAVAGTIVTV
jgi:hypothetical protein